MHGPGRRRKTQRGRRGGSRRRRRPTRKQRGGNASAPATTQEKAIVFAGLNNGGHGFYSALLYLLHTYIHAKKTGADYFVKDNADWPYRFEKGWHDYFTTLKMADDLSPYKDVKEYTFYTANELPPYTVRDYADAIRNVYVLRPDLIEKADALKKEMGNNYTSILIRRGDKTNGSRKEMDQLSLEDIFKMTSIKDEPGNLFIATDDYTVIEEAKKLLPSKRIWNLVKENDRGAYLNTIRDEKTPQEKKDHIDTLLISTEVFMGGKPAWTDIRSRTGVFQTRYDWENVKMYPIPIDPEIPQKKIISSSFDGEVSP